MPYVGKSMDRRRNARRRQLSGAHTAISWNAAHPVGTRVRYWPIYPPIESVPHTDTVTVATLPDDPRPKRARKRKGAA